MAVLTFGKLYKYNRRIDKTNPRDIIDSGTSIAHRIVDILIHRKQE